MGDELQLLPPTADQASIVLLPPGFEQEIAEVGGQREESLEGELELLPPAAEDGIVDPVLPIGAGGLNANVPATQDASQHCPETEPERRAKMSIGELILFFGDLLETASSQPFCVKKTSSGVLKRQCTCLHVLRDPVLRLPVARYLASLERKSKQSKDELVLEWYKYANSSKEYGRHNYTNWYFIPWDGTHSSEDDLSLLLTEKMCTNAMLTVMEIGKFWYKSIIKAYTTMGVISSSETRGKTLLSRITIPV